MANYQSLTAIGNVGSEPEFKYTVNGVPFATFRLAVNERTANGEQKTLWLSVSTWRQTAEIVQKYVHKGDLLMIVGKIELAKFADKNGEPGAAINVTANQVALLGSKRGDGEQAASERFADGGDIPF